MILQRINTSPDSDFALRTSELRRRRLKAFFVDCLIFWGKARQATLECLKLCFRAKLVIYPFKYADLKQLANLYHRLAIFSILFFLMINFLNLTVYQIELNAALFLSYPRSNSEYS